MNRVTKQFRELKRNGKCGLVAYVTCGDPDPETTVGIVRELERSGASCIELGVPFSDPIADGPVIQAASQRSLERGTTMADVLGVARRVRSGSEIPLVLFSYLNPIHRYGYQRFAADAAGAGIDSVLVTDLPPESAGDLKRHLDGCGIGSVFLLAPTSTDRRMALVGKMSDGFVYYVSTNGVTGARRELDPGLVQRLREVRLALKKPLAVGFGVSTHEQYRTLAPLCDAVVVGSAIVRAIDQGEVAGAAERAGRAVREILNGEAP
ncbi:MAG: tryptophan synthase subunit alpha [Thermoanaerobaculia bacterium]